MPLFGRRIGSASEKTVLDGTEKVPISGTFYALVSSIATYVRGLLVDDTAYNATTWNGDTTHAPSKNAVRDKIEAMGSGSGDFVGPSSSTDNAVVRFDSTTGKLGQNSLMTVDDSGSANIPTGQTYKINGSAHTHTGLVTNGDSHDHNGGDGAAITDANLSTSDITTNNASTSKHGFLKKLNNDATYYMDGTGNWSVPAGTGGGGGGGAGAIALFDHHADVGNVGTGEDDLYSDTIAAGQLASNDDKIFGEYGGVFVSSATATRAIKAYFGGTQIFDTGTLTLSLSSAWTLYLMIIRVSSSVIRYEVSFTTEGAALAAYTSAGEVTGLTLSGTNVLKLTGESAGVGAATNDIVAKLGTVWYFPVAGTNGVVDDTAYDASTWNGDTTHAPSKNAVRDKIESLSSGGGDFVKLATHTSSGAADIQLLSWKNDSLYEIYTIKLYNIIPATDNVEIELQFSTDGGSTWQATNYAWTGIEKYTGGTIAIGADSGQSYIKLATSIGNGSYKHLTGTLDLAVPGSANHKSVIGSTRYWTYAGNQINWDVIGDWLTTTSIDGIRILASSGNISGTATIYGMTK